MDEKFGIPCLIDPSDPDFWEDEKTMMTQLAELMHQLPEMVEQPKHPIDEWIDDNMDRIADDIAGLAQIPSIPEDPDHINDVDEAAAIQAKEAAERSLADSDASLEYAEAQAQLAEAMAQLRSIERMRKSKGR